MPIKIEIPQSFLKDLNNYGQRIARDLAVTFKNEMTKEYKTTIAAFYSAYTPMRYHRRYGLYESGKPYYRNSHGTRFSGGVEISSDGMPSHYHDGADAALSSALAGYHGRPALGLDMGPEIYEHMLRYRDLLFNSCESLVKL